MDLGATVCTAATTAMHRVPGVSCMHIPPTLMADRYHSQPVSSARTTRTVPPGDTRAPVPGRVIETLRNAHPRRTIAASRLGRAILPTWTGRDRQVFHRVLRTLGEDALVKVRRNRRSVPVESLSHEAFALSTGERTSRSAPGAPVDIRRRLDEFAAVPREEYFSELVYCLLTPQSSAVNAARAVDALRETRLLAQTGRFRGHSPTPVCIHPVPQHEGKADRRGVCGVRRNRRHDCRDARCARIARLARGNVRGLGWKEASHFLRNIGRRNLAILDDTFSRISSITACSRPSPQR